MPKVQFVLRRSFFLIGSLVATLALLLTACGATPVKSPVTPPIVVNQTGCPSNSAVSSTPAPANVVLTKSNSYKTTLAHVGDVIEIDLPFGTYWSGPTTSQGELQLQTPAGYAWTPTKVCVWRFTARGTGTTILKFSASAICDFKTVVVCPANVTLYPFTISVQ